MLRNDEEKNQVGILLSKLQLELVWSLGILYLIDGTLVVKAYWSILFPQFARIGPKYNPM